MATRTPLVLSAEGITEELQVGDTLDLGASSDPGESEALLTTDTSGLLTLQNLRLNTVVLPAGSAGMLAFDGTDLWIYV